MRIMLRKLFASTISTKGGFQKYADVPNVHLGLHYERDIENFATTYNSTTMIGEQKHKVFKQHAGHTNSHENDLQLLKAVNTSQTLRFLLDSTFHNSEYSRISMQLEKVVGNCPILKERFLGCREGAKFEISSADTEISQYSGIDVSRSSFLTARTGCPVPLKRIETTDKEADLMALQALYFEEYSIVLHIGMRFKVHYWSYFSGQPSMRSREFDGRYQFRARVDWFVRLRDDMECSFYRIRRIFTMTIGTMIRVFFVLSGLQRDISQELEAAPYPVFKKSIPGQEVVVGIRKLDPVIFHFVSKGTDSWWYNPYVPNFL